MTTAAVVSEVGVGRPVLGIAGREDHPNEVVFGGSGRGVFLWDSRLKAEHVVLSTVGRLGSWMGGIAWRPGSEYIFATGSYDGSVALWDIRATVALGAVELHTGKVLSMVWAGSDVLSSVGEDGHVRSCSMTPAGVPVGEGNAV